MSGSLPYDFTLDLENPVSTHTVQFGLVPGRSRVLDVGCHAGQLGSALIRQKQCTVTGIDSDEAALAVAEMRLTHTLQIDIESRGWASRLTDAFPQKFDVILFGDVLEHTRYPEIILQEASSLLTSDGRVIVSLPNVANLRVRMKIALGRFEYEDSGILDRTHLRFFTRKTARELVSNAGYQILSEHYSGYSLPKWLIDRFPTLFAVNIILVAEQAD